MALRVESGYPLITGERREAVDCKLDEIPDACTSGIISFLNAADTSALAGTNSSLNNKTIVQVSWDHVLLIKNFIDDLITKSEGMSQENKRVLEELKREVNSYNIEEIRNLKTLKEHEQQFEIQLMTTIQTLARTKLESLKSSVTPPHFFKGIFEVTQFYAKFISISRKLLKMGYTEKAIKIAQLITDSKIKAEMIEEIAITLIARDDAEGAIQVINSNLTHNAKDKALYKIAVKLIEGNHTQRAIQISESIFDPHVKESLLRDISQVFIREENLERAHEFINQISNNQLKFSLTNEIVKICLNLGEVDTAIESVCIILEGNSKDQALFCLATDLIMRKKISERAIEIAGSIDTPHWKTKTLEAALNALKIIIEEKNPVEF